MTKTRINLNPEVTGGNIRTLNGDVCDIADNVHGFMFKFRLSPEGNGDSRRSSNYEDLDIIDDVLDYRFKAELFLKGFESKVFDRSRASWLIKFDSIIELR